MPGLFACFPEVYHGQKAVPDLVKRVFQQATDGKEFMTAAELAAFICQRQGSTVTEEQAAERIAKIHSEASYRSHHLFGLHGNRRGDGHNVELNLQGFLSYLLHPDYNGAEAVTSNIMDDMTAPLSHYYMHTSHNSYLTGNQLTSKSSTAPIVKALLDGCRVIELDCWERRGKIMVLHGNTLTKPVAFADCIEAIKKNAFVASEYPVIITIENHLPVDLQQQAAQILISTLGDLLFIPPPGERPPKTYRSPEELKNKIVISDRPPSDSVEEQVAEEPECGSEKTLERDPSIAKSAGPVRTVQKAAAVMGAITHNTDQAEEGNERAREFDELLYIYSEKPSEMKQAAKDELVMGETATMANMSEPQLKKFIGKNPGSLIEYTKTNLGRMYPHGLRFDSSNADPMVAWCHGFQLAAVNIQGQNRATWVARTFFKANGKCGYIKKPDIFLKESPLNHDYIQNLSPKLVLKIKVLTGTDWHKGFDFFKKPDYYVKIGVHGVHEDESKHQTPVGYNNNQPIWENETYEFPLRVPEIAILRLEVWEEDRFQRNDFAGQSCLPVRSLQPGIRVIPLCSKKGVARGSKLLCEISMESLNG